MCPVCSKQVKNTDTKGSVQCSICDLWLHVPCGKITDNELSFINNMVESRGYHIWCCDTCGRAFHKLNKKVTMMETRLDNMQVEVKKNTEACAANTSRLEEVEKTLKEATTNKKQERGDIVKDVTKAWSNELAERASKKDNVICYGLQEAGSDVISGEIRKSMDNELICDVFTTVNLELDMEKDIKVIARAGQWTAAAVSKPRPLIIGFRDPDKRTDLFTAARKLASTKYKNISVSPDLTNQQRDDDRDILKEFDRRNAEMDEAEALNFIYRCVGQKGERVIVKSKRLSQHSAKYNNMREKRLNLLLEGGPVRGRGQPRGGRPRGGQPCGGDHNRMLNYQEEFPLTSDHTTKRKQAQLIEEERISPPSRRGRN